MRESKTLILEENGNKLQFTITQLGALEALKLVREVASLFTDTAFIYGTVAQTFLRRIFDMQQTELSADEEAQMQQFQQMETIKLITSLVQSVISGLEDDKIDSLVSRCLEGVIFTQPNGAQHKGESILRGQYLDDFTMLITLVYEVLLLNFSGAIDRLKKLLDRK